MDGTNTKIHQIAKRIVWIGTEEKAKTLILFGRSHK